MIVTEIYNGQGLGNQLWCYVVTRVIAKDKGYDFGIMHGKRFKCLDFMELDLGKEVTGGEGKEGGPPAILPNGIQYYYNEKKILHPKTKADIRIYDKNLVNVKDNTKIDGIMQDEQYIIHHKTEIRNWLKVKQEFNNLKYSRENICVINFRGGEYVYIKNVFLPQKYWNDAINHMKTINPDMEFIVVTDDIKTASKFFPKFKISHESIGSDYSIINNAYYLILSNSSFAFFPTWLNEKVKLAIAPKYWAQYNTSDGYWGCGYNITSNWKYLNRAGELLTYEECLLQLKKYNDKEWLDTIPPIYAKNPFGFFIGKIVNKLFPKKTTPMTIIEYRKNIKIYDIFTYNGEVDILEIRLNILKDYVDQFIIVEAPTTFSGLQKPLYFEQHKKRFKDFLSKIKYFVIDDYPNDKSILKLADQSSNVPKNGPEHWRREFYQKESIKKALTDLQDDDICFIGDVDEIWNPEVLIDYRKDSVFKLKQKVYTYYLNNKSNEPWAGTIVTKYKNIKNNCLNHLRTKSKTKYTYIKNGGWHFTSMGGINEIRRKLNDSYTKESYNTDEVQEKLVERFGHKDYMGRKFKFLTDESDLPKYILENKYKYKHLFKPDNE